MLASQLCSFFSLKVALAILCHLYFYMNFGIRLSISTKIPAGHLGRFDLLTILSCLTQKQHMSPFIWIFFSFSQLCSLFFSITSLSYFWSDLSLSTSYFLVVLFLSFNFNYLLLVHRNSFCVYCFCVLQPY